MKDIFLYKAMPLVAMLFLSYVTIFNSNVFLVLSLILIIPYYVHRKILFFTNKYLILFFAMGLFGSIINLIGTDNGIGGTISFIVSIGIAIFCIENTTLCRFFVLGLCLYTVYFLYSGLFINEISFYSLYDDIGVSRNYPGFVMCACCCFWGFFKYIKKQEFTILLPILCSVFAFFLDGRSSLGVLCGISLFCLFFTFRKILLVFVLCSVILLITYIDDIVNLFLLTNLANSGMETGRYDIWKGYLENIDLASLILGLNTMDVPVIRAVDGNPHNAFLNFHYRMGLFGLVGLILIIYRSIKVLVNKESFVLLAFMAFLLFRIFFDACLGSTTDYIIFAIFLYPILYNHRVFRMVRRKHAYKKALWKHKKSFLNNVKLVCVLQKIEKYI